MKPIDAFACHRCAALLVPPCVGHLPRAIDLTLKCPECGHEHRGWVEYGKRTRIHETPVSKPKGNLSKFLDQQMDRHPELIVEADEAQLQRIADLVDGIDPDAT